MAKSVLQPFEDYQKARIKFVQHIAELATRQQNIAVLNSAGVMKLLRPLLLDSVTSIQQSAALAIGRMANYSEEVAESVIENEILPQLLFSMTSHNRFFKKAACFVLTAIAKHSYKLANELVKAGAIEPLINCLEDFDSSVKESATKALGYISKHSESLANIIVQSRGIDNLILCLQEPEMNLKRASVQTLCYIASHNEYVSLPIAEKGLDVIMSYLPYSDIKLKRSVCMLLGSIAKHSVTLADKVINKLNPQKLISCLSKNEDISVRKNAAFCLRELVNKNTLIAALIVDNNGSQNLIDYVSSTVGEARLNGILCLGSIASFKDDLAYSIIKHNGVEILKQALQSENDQYIKSAVCYTIGHLGRHSPNHANEIANSNILPLLMFYHMSSESTDDLKEHSFEALRKIIESLNKVSTLEPLLQICSERLIKTILNQLVKHLNGNKTQQKEFLKNGGLAKLQEMKKKVNVNLVQQIEEINSFFPESCVKYSSPDYVVSLLDKIT